MANEVNITITGTNLSGPAFASAVRDMAKLRAEAALLGEEMGKIGKLKIDPNEATSSLIALRSKMQSLGIADIADVNVNPGRITTQLQLLKRLIDQAGISDILDVNVDKPALTSQLQDIASISETIPVNFKIGELPHIPQLGQVQNIKFGFTSGLGPDQIAQLSEAQAEFSKLGLTMSDVANRMAILDGSAARMGSTLLAARDDFSSLGMTMDNVKSALAILNGETLQVALAQNEATRAAMAAANAQRVLNPLWQAGGGWLGFLTGKLLLFGGAFGNIPILGAISGWHLLVETAIELGTSLLEAAVAMGVFAAAATPTVKDLFAQMQSLYTVTQAYQTSIYPLTGGFQKMAQAVQPQVYTLFGEALIFANSKTGILTTVATGAGKVLEDLGARFVYATTQGNGMSTFLKESVGALAGWGNLIGNIGGIIGNVFKVLPGYAATILQALGDVSHALEMITSTGPVQALLGIGLAAHGAAIWIGLLGTAAAFLVSRGLNLIPGIAALAFSGLSKIGLGGSAAAQGIRTLGIAAGNAAALPWGWIAIAAAGLAFLVYQMVNAKSAAQQFADAIQKSITGTGLTSLSQALSSNYASISAGLKSANQQLSQFVAVNGKALQAQQLLFHNAAGTPLQHQYQALQENADKYNLALQQVKQDQQTVNEHVSQAAGVFGSTAAAWAALNGAGVTSAQILDTNKQHWAEALIEAEGFNNAIRATTQSLGRYGAAQNALNFVAGDSVNALGQIDSSMSKVTQAEDQLINAVLGGEQAFLGYMGTLDQMQTDSKNAKFGIDGLSLSSRTLANDFYGSAIPAAQKVIDSLQIQNITTKDLTTVIATQAGELLKYAGNSDAAKSAIIALINNALGPNTVSLQTLNHWVNTNQTSLGGYKSIIDKTTISAGSLANVLQNDLNAQFQQDILKSSGATRDMQNFTDALVNGGSQTSRFHNARQQLINDLENAGFSAHDATAFVDGLQRKIDAMHGKTVGVGVHASGSGQITARENILGETQQVIGNLLFVNKGGRVPGYGDMDSVMAMLTPGEAVIPKWLVPIMAPLLRKYGVPGFASGGYVQDPQSIADFEGNMGGQFIHQPWPVYGKAESSKFLNDLNAAAQKMAQAAAAAAGGGGPGTPGPGGGTAYQNQLLAMKLAPYWANGMEWADWRALWNQESGWNQYARNPSSGAYGIPQALPPDKMGAAANPPQSNPAAQISWGIGYIKGRYGDPIGAWAHEVAFNWYDNGGWLMPGMNIAMNGTGHPEWVPPPGTGSGALCLEIQPGGASAFEQFMVEAIRHWVRIKGGGNVQKAFGRSL